MNLTETAVMEELLLTPTVTPTVPAEQLTTGLTEIDNHDISWVYLRTNSESDAVSAGFWVMRTEVTNKQYRACCSEGLCSEPISGYPNPVSEDAPVVSVTLKQAEAFCSRVGGELPSISQWQEAANSFREDEPVCHFRSERPMVLTPGEQSAAGLYGNVWEWTKEGMIAGGSYRTARQDIFTRRTARQDPTYGAEDVGFRCIRPIP